MTCDLCTRVANFPFTTRTPHEHDGQWFGRAPCGCVRTKALLSSSASFYVDGDVSFLLVDNVRLCTRHDSLGMLGHRWPVLLMSAAEVLLPWRAAEALERWLRS